MPVVAEEAPGAYKDVDQVVQTVHKTCLLYTSESLVFSQFNVKITKTADGSLTLHAEIEGDEFNQAIHEVRDEVKAVTFLSLIHI